MGEPEKRPMDRWDSGGFTIKNVLRWGRSGRAVDLQGCPQGAEIKRSVHAQAAQHSACTASLLLHNLALACEHS